MNSDLTQLHAYPFEKLATLKSGISPPKDKHPISLALGEPQHPAPGFIHDALVSHMHQISRYPTTRGTLAFREAVATWLVRRFSLPSNSIDADKHVLPVNGTREALFAFAQCVVDRRQDPVVIMPNPFYQIYEGAALLSGATPWFINTIAANDFVPDFSDVPDAIWQRCQLVYLCSPGNPTGKVLNQETLAHLLDMADRYDFVIASDECYSEIYPDENAPPLGLLDVAAQLGRDNYHRCVVFHSLSKRSNVPGLRSGFVAGDAEILQAFYRYRTYHGCAMPLPSQLASIAAWQDEHHVEENRRLYRKKFSAVRDILQPVLETPLPDAAFYLWPKLPLDDVDFARELYAQQNVTVLPGSFLSRTVKHQNPGKGHARLALVAPLEDCITAAKRIRAFIYP